MGLLKRARSILWASRSDGSGFEDLRQTGGLLGKSLEFLNSLTRPANRREDRSPSVPALSATDTTAPEAVPRTWRESGQSEPAEIAEQQLEPETLSPAERQDRLLRGLDEIEEGIEAPGQLFALLKVHLQLNRAALLLYDPVRLVFAPWAVYGFDKTTSRRLRIPLGANDTINRLASGTMYNLDDPAELQPFQQYFSFREFSNLEKLILVPFIQESRFMGLLLIAEMGIQIDPDNLEIFKILANRAARLFYRARERHLEGARRGLPDRPEVLRESVESALRPYLDKGIAPLMIRIDTAALVESVRQRNAYIDPFRLSQDLSRVVLSVFHSLGPVFQVQQDRILILITNGADRIDPQNADLLIYHLKSTLMRLLPELSEGEEINLNEEIRRPGADIEEVLTFLAEIV
jgi:hypothetical protein